jgi:hypothetical protein
LEDLGWIEGRKFVLDTRAAAGDFIAVTSENFFFFFFFHERE